MAAVTQVRHKHSEGRACYDKKLAEGKTHREALRSLKRQISDAVFARLREDARRAESQARDPGGQQGNGSAAGAAGSPPETGSSGKPLPGLPPAYDQNLAAPPDTKRHSFSVVFWLIARGADWRREQMLWNMPGDGPSRNSEPGTLAIPASGPQPDSQEPEVMAGRLA
jgi:hypothetical protein